VAGQSLGGACLAEQFQVGNRDLALLVASLANKPVRVHARQAVDGDELQEQQKKGHALDGGKTGSRTRGATKVPSPCGQGIYTSVAGVPSPHGAIQTPGKGHFLPPDLLCPRVPRRL
jgi:hypothetical protein